MFFRGSSVVKLVDVGPRDGLQIVGPFVPTEQKIALVRRLHAAGLASIEIGSFVAAAAVPQLADVREVMAGTLALPGLDARVLVATERRGLQAVSAGARHLVFVLSVSEQHNASNVGRTPRQSIAEAQRLLERIPQDVRVRLDVSTAFDCPFDGPVAPEQTLALIERLAGARDGMEIALCDTTGRVTPDRVHGLFVRCIEAFPQVTRWAFHGHDTYGMGVSNAIAAWQAGVSILDASIGGLGGCPFAPGATGNVATEDLVWLFDRLGVETNVNADALLAIAHDVAALPGACPGGRVRIASEAARPAVVAS